MQSDLASSLHTTYRSVEQQTGLEPEGHLGNSVNACDADSGYWQRRLMAFIQAMFVLLLILLGLHFFTAMVSGQFSLVPFFPLLFLWLVLYVGHVGAYRGRASFLQAYVVLNLLIISFVAVSFVLFPAMLGTVLCTLDGGYNGGCSWDETKSIAHATFIGFLFAFIPCLPAAMGAVYALRARNELLLAKMRADIEGELNVALDCQEERAGLLHAQPISATPNHPAHYYYQCEYRPMVYVPNPPTFSPASNGATAVQQQQQQTHVQATLPFPAPSPTAYYYYPPPPPRSGAPVQNSHPTLTQ